MTTDTIADMLTRVRNANQRFHHKLKLPSSITKVKIAEILKEQGYIEKYFIFGAIKKTLVIYLKYVDKKRVIHGLKRISKPGLRVYVTQNELPKVLNGLGIAIISTSKGIMTDEQARKSVLGGEVIAYIW